MVAVVVVADVVAVVVVADVVAVVVVAASAKNQQHRWDEI